MAGFLILPKSYISFIYLFLNSVIVSIYSNLMAIERENSKRANSYHVSAAAGGENEIFGQKIVLLFVNGMDKFRFINTF